MEVLSVEWLEKYLNAEMGDVPIGEHIQNATDPQVKRLLWTIASTKYRWSWISEAEKKDVLVYYARVFQAAKEGKIREWTDSIRGYLKASGWQLMAV